MATTVLKDKELQICMNKDTSHLGRAVISLVLRPDHIPKGGGLVAFVTSLGTVRKIRKDIGDRNEICIQRK